MNLVSVIVGLIALALQDARLSEIRKQLAKVRHTGKSKFICTFITTE